MKIKVVSVEHMREIEAAADQSGLTYDEMMDRAGHAVADVALSMITNIDEPRITLLIGSGNNGGDGLVAARYLAEQHGNVDVRCYLMERRDDDPLLQQLLEKNIFVAYAPDDNDFRVVRNMVASADLVIDAIFGIGVRLPIKGNVEKRLRQINRALHESEDSYPPERILSPIDPLAERNANHIKVLAVDCPSGVNCDKGEVDANVIQADSTVTFISAKPGLLTFPAASYVGKLFVATIGVSDELSPIQKSTPYLASAEAISALLPDRSVDSHKGTYGKSFVIAGSTNYVGAAALSSKAAYRAGCGLVTVGAPGPVISAVAGIQPETTWVMLPHDMGVVSQKAVNVVFESLNDYDALLIGPGLGTEETTGQFLTELLDAAESDKNSLTKRGIGFFQETASSAEQDSSQERNLPPLIIDADGLNLLAKHENWWQQLPENTIITPHPGEMSRLSGKTIDEINAARIQLASEMAKKWLTVVVLKGAHTVIAAPDGQVFIMPFKTDALATAGTGDVLAGLITGLRAQGLSAFNAAVTGAYVHGLAGEKTAAHLSSRAAVASDILDHVSAAFLQIDSL